MTKILSNLLTSNHFLNIDDFPFFSDVSNSIQADSEVVVPVANVSGLLGRSARLPCDTTPPSRDNPLLLVIWFKEPSPDPIYRYIVSDKYISVLGRN